MRSKRKEQATLTRIMPARVEDIVEQICKVIYDHADDERGLAQVHLQLLRPDEKRLYITYHAKEEEKQ